MAAVGEDRLEITAAGAGEANGKPEIGNILAASWPASIFVEVWIWGREWVWRTCYGGSLGSLSFRVS